MTWEAPPSKKPGTRPTSPEGTTPLQVSSGAPASSRCRSGRRQASSGRVLDMTRATEEGIGEPRPTSTLGVSPYLGYPDGDAAAEWLQKVLGFGPAEAYRNDDGSWFEGELQAGSSRVHIGGGSPMEPGTGAGALIIVHVADVDASHQRIVDAGVDVDPPQDQPYGPRTCHVTDPWGYRWYLWQGEARYS
jgi:uncharacterized glyoxalase superfamily protein PhnB